MISGPLVRVGTWTTTPKPLSVIGIVVVIIVAGCGTVAERLIDKIRRVGSTIALLLLLLLFHVSFGSWDCVAVDAMCFGGH